MNERLAEFFAEKEKHLQELEVSRREAVLRAAGLVEEVREYVPHDQGLYGLSNHSEVVNGERRFFKRTEKLIEVTDEEFQRIEALLAAQKEYDDKIAEKERAEKVEAAAKEAQNQLTEIKFFTDAGQEESRSAEFLQVLAWIMWVGGIILAIVSAQKNVEVAGKYFSTTNTYFDWMVFFSTAAIYIVAGGFAMALSGICKNLHDISARFKRSRFSIERK